VRATTSGNDAASLYAGMTQEMDGTRSARSFIDDPEIDTSAQRYANPRRILADRRVLPANRAGKTAPIPGYRFGTYNRRVFYNLQRRSFMPS